MAMFPLVIAMSSQRRPWSSQRGGRQRLVEGLLSHADALFGDAASRLWLVIALFRPVPATLPPDNELPCLVDRLSALVTALA
jgi:hypothetical protein